MKKGKKKMNKYLDFHISVTASRNVYCSGCYNLKFEFIRSNEKDDDLCFLRQVIRLLETEFEKITYEKDKK